MGPARRLPFAINGKPAAEDTMADDGRTFNRVMKNPPLPLA
jgi:hypothetical protein